MALKKEEQELHDKMVAEWLAKGNKLQYANHLLEVIQMTLINLIDGKENPRKRLTKRSNVLY